MDKIDNQSRKWQLTINNPNDNGFTHERIKDEISKMKSVAYWCMSDEVGEKGTYHTHLYIAFNSAMRFSTLKKKFDTAHFEMARGTSQQNRDYVFKEGKWENDKKHETNIKETQEEFGEMPLERQGARNDLADLYDMIKQGMSNFEIIEECPNYMMNIDKIERSRQIIREEQYKNTFRQLEVTYVFGESGTGKSRDIMELYNDYQQIYRVTDYDHPFDGYQGQDTIVFEDFRSDLRISDMLNFLDGYPLQLPCRYANKIACFTKVFITSNIPLSQQYQNIQVEQLLTWKALLRRIHKVKQYTRYLNLECALTEYVINKFQVPGIEELYKIENEVK